MISAGTRYSSLGDHRKSPRVVDAVSGCAMLIRREVLNTVGLFDEDFFFSFEDIDLCLRAKAAGFETTVVPEARAFHRGSASIGKRSADRLYYAARNHLLLAHRGGGPANLTRQTSVAALNVAHAIKEAATFGPRGLQSTLAGILDHRRRRYGPKR